MKKASIKMLVWAAALAAANALAGDSAPLTLDTRTGTRIARETETIAYSTAWNRGADVQVFVDGVLLKEAATPATGTVVWNAAEAGIGVHTLTHVSGGTTLTAQFVVEGVWVESADPMRGSITLAWTDAGTGSGVTYSIYRGEGEDRAEAKVVAPAVTETSWTDENYWKSESGLKPLNYWVVANVPGEGEREYKPVQTRRRFGVFVGVGTFENGWCKDNESDIPAANELVKLAQEGGFSNVQPFTGGKAKKKEVQEAVQALATATQTGDYVVLFFSTHGICSPISHQFTGLAMHDVKYGIEELAQDLKAILKGKKGPDENTPGLSAVCIVNACYSGGAVNASKNVAWITACPDEIKTKEFPKFGTPLLKFLLTYGWGRGRGRAGSSDFVTFGNLADYAARNLARFLPGKECSYTPLIEKSDVLENFVAGKAGTAEHASAPHVPSNVQVGDKGLFWDEDTQAEYYIVLQTDLDGKSNPQIVRICPGAYHKCTLPGWYGQPHKYQVAAMNEVGISEWSEPKEGSRILRERVASLQSHFGLASAAEIAGILGTAGYVEFSRQLTAEAVGVEGQTALEFTTGGDEPWFGQTAESHDGTNAARSGPIEGEQTSWLETEVTGPGTIGFWWKASCADETVFYDEYDETGNPTGEIIARCHSDYGEFLVDDSREVLVCGQGEWQYASFEIGIGPHVLRWQYQKGDAGADGDDCVWLDEVTWTSGIAWQEVTFNANGGEVADTNLFYEVAKTYSLLPQPIWKGHTFVGWFTAATGGEPVTAASLVTADEQRTLYAHWVEPTTVWRFYSKKYKGHFFTISEAEKDNLIATNPSWKFEGGAYRAYTNQAEGTVALYRFYSKRYRGHFFTVNEAEKDGLIAGNPNWKYEGVAYYVYPAEVEGSLPVYRFWSKAYKHHFYTTSAAEKDNLIATNPKWKYETIAFWALPLEEAAARGRAVKSEKRNEKSEMEAGGEVKDGEMGTQGRRGAGTRVGGGVAVTTSDGSDGSAVADGDEGTGWSPEGAGDAWVALSYAEPVEVESVEVAGENLPEGLRVLWSEDAEAWEEKTPMSARYVWVALPGGESVPVVKEILVVP